MMMLAGAMFFLFGATQIWTESSSVNVFPDTVPQGSAKASVRLYASQGEAESFQLCLRADAKGFRGRDIPARPLDKQIGPPRIHAVGYVSLDKAQQRQWPDPLLPVEPFDVPPRQTRVFWVTYAVPRDAKPGLHTGKVDVVSDAGPRLSVDVTIEVFAFAQPEVASFRTLFPLDRHAFERAYGIEGVALEPWKAVYDALAGYKVSSSLWDGGGLVRLIDGKVDASAFQEHLDYAMSRANMAVIDLGGGRGGMAPLEATVGEGGLQPYLEGMHAWLDAKGWLDRACVSVVDFPARDRWPQTRDVLFRVKRADPAMPRLAIGQPHPYFERFVEILAVPLRDAHPFAVARWREGMSLAAQPAHLAARVAASSSGIPPGEKNYASLPGDAYDGCLHTYWRSDRPPARSSPQWIEIAFDEPVDTDEFYIGWKTGLESADIETLCSYNGETFSPARVRWRHHVAQDSFEDNWSEGEFRFKKTFRGIRLVFRGSVQGGPVGIRELEFGHAPSPDTIERIKPVSVWMDASVAAPPSLALGAHPIEARLAPWVCWRYGVTGLRGPGLTGWPEGWTTDDAWMSAPRQENDDGRQYLYYPAPEKPAPSIRLERLRDGIEDYEYLVAMEKALPENPDVDPLAARCSSRQPFPLDRLLADLDAQARFVVDGHTRMGRALTRIAKTGKAGKVAASPGMTP
ncbi:MAG TPA: DUF4091 domain-containing protein [Candidatus Hydrogenedentes bacterium]|mgnify:CR=1 FL=1|nr:DUF4091 domain-containing protein [Candidatus Hydrogenedentota bacterium]